MPDLGEAKRKKGQSMKLEDRAQQHRAIVADGFGYDWQMVHVLIVDFVYACTVVRAMVSS